MFQNWNKAMSPNENSHQPAMIFFNGFFVFHFFIEAMRFFWASSCEDFFKLIFQNWNLATSTSFLVYVYKI